MRQLCVHASDGSSHTLWKEHRVIIPVEKPLVVALQRPAASAGVTVIDNEGFEHSIPCSLDLNFENSK